MLRETGSRTDVDALQSTTSPRYVQIRPGTARVVHIRFWYRNPPKFSASGCAVGAGRYLMLMHACAITQDHHKFHPLTHQPDRVCMHAE
jgi:hypothetical protein